MWSEAYDGHVLLTRRGDLTRATPGEWSCILTWGAFTTQASGYGMAPATAIRRALDAAEQVDSRALGSPE